MTYNFFPYFQEEAIMMNVCSCLEKNFFFQLQSWAAYQLSGGRIVCLILGQQKPIGNYNTMGRSLEQNRSIIKSKRGGEGMVHTFLVDAGGRNIVDSFNSTVSKIFFARINIEIAWL